MNIAIIGGGWVGCHLSLKLKNEHKITIFEKNDDLFQETSYKNQNRLHLGFHYPRSHKTRDLCVKTFARFENDYGFLTNDVNPNLYCISEKDTLLDFNTFLKIYNDDRNTLTTFNEDNYGIQNVEGCLVTNEKHINFKMANEFFNRELKPLTVKKTITNLEVDELKRTFDLVINCTNNHILDTSVGNYFYELTLTLLYEKDKDYDFGSLTVMDGKFVSLFPYEDNLYTLTDVENTPIKSFSCVKSLNEYRKRITKKLIKNKKRLFEEKIISYIPNFLDNFKYKNHFISTKSKIVSSTDSRYPIINKNGNLINCFTGKIQGIFIIEDYINTIICQMNN